MNRLLRPSILLAAAIATAATSARAAGEAPTAADPTQAVLGPIPSGVEQDEGAAPAAEATAPAPAPAPAATVTDEAEKDSDGGDSVPSRLKPGAIDEEKTEGDKFPVGFGVSLGNSIGTGTFAPELSGSSPYTRQASFGTSLTLRPSFRLPTFDVLPKMSLSGSLDMGIEWMSTSNGSPVADRLVRLSDFIVALSFPGLVKEEFTNISLSPTLSVRLPLSLQSRFQNQFGAAGLSLPVSWGSPELPMGLGSFRLGYTPAVRVNGYTRASASVPCGTPIPAFLPVSPTVDPINGVDEIPIVVSRQEEFLGDGTCVVAGRQTLGSVSNSGAVSWSMQDHSVSFSMTHAIGFKRPLTDDPALSSPNAATGLQNNLADQLSGSLSYSYSLPLDIPPSLSISAGISSQPAYSMRGDVRVPFLDLLEGQTWNNNFTSAFVSLDAEI